MAYLMAAKTSKSKAAIDATKKPVWGFPVRRFTTAPTTNQLRIAAMA